MTGASDFTVTAVWVGMALIAALTLYLAPKVIRDFRRDRNRERVELTSEHIDTRAITTIHGGEPFMRHK